MLSRVLFVRADPDNGKSPTATTRTWLPLVGFTSLGLQKQTKLVDASLEYLTSTLVATAAKRRHRSVKDSDANPAT